MTRKTTWNNRNTIGQKLSQFYHLQFDAFETWQSRPVEFTDYCEEKAAAEIVLMNMNFWFL